MFKKHNPTLALVWAVILFVIPLPFIQTLDAGLPAIYASSKLAIQWGSIAYVWMLAAIYLSTRPHYLDRLIGLPKLYMVHGMISLAALLLAWLHMEGTVSTGWIKQTGTIAFYLYLFLALYSLIFLAGWLTKRVPFLAKIKKGLERKVFKHELSVWIHKLNLVATVLVFIHIQLISYIRAITPYMMLIYAATLLVFATYVYNKLKPALTETNAVMTNLTMIADNVAQLTIESHHLLDYQAGDYLFLSFPGMPGLKEPHPFSLVNVPKKDQEIVLAIRGDGDFTKQLQDLSCPQKVLVTPGYGRFQEVIAEQQPEHLLIIAGGIGVVPLLSIIQGNPQIATELFYNAHTQDNLIYQKEIQTLAERDNFTAHCQVGRFQDYEVLNALEYDSLILIAGPQAMADHWEQVLQKEGVEIDKIFYEEFEW
ncbi:iron reductase [Lactobacillus sp.]|uniref:iron reductase n=1 Tax=Lactobacillus sp. TaxID=1591 RepID=UPI003EF20A0E